MKFFVLLSNRFIRFLVCFSFIGLLIVSIPQKIVADEVPTDFHALKKEAEKGDADSQYKLGWMYENGQGVPQDYKKAVYWYTKAAEQGETNAQLNLGYIYYEGNYGGQGVVPDYKEAARWFRKAAEQGNSSAQFELGYMYDFWHPLSGLDQNCQEAIKWYLKSAKQGKVGAQLRLGEMYRGDKKPLLCSMKDIEQDYKEAARWFRKAAEQGNSSAQFELGYMHYEGQGVVQDYKQTIYWYTKAAEQGNAYAQSGLGWMYFEGKGVPQNYKLAYVWSSLAASAGNEGARHNRDVVAQILTPQLLGEAQELAAKLQYRITHSSESSKSKSTTPKKANLYEPEIKGFGSGFIISKEGYILTCYHVIENSNSVKVKVGDNFYSAKVIRKDLGLANI